MKFQSLWRHTLLPLLPMLLWGSLFPMIKIGYAACGVDTGSIPDILLFAALRFTVCGILVSGASLVRRERPAAPVKKSIIGIIVMGLFAIVFHYACTYIGLTMTDSSKTALLKQVGALVYVCTAFLFLPEEKFSMRKIFGGIVGFVGILLLNLTGGAVRFTLGDILILGASVCTVVSGIMSHRLVQKNPPVLVTGISQLAGGIILLAAGLAMGGRMPDFGLPGLLAFAYICAASIGGYLLWAYVQRTESLSRLYIIKFAEPLFACILGAVLLGEDILKLQYLGAFVLICAGIMLASRKAE